MKSVLFLMMLAIGSACSNETELKKSIFVPDKDFPELPEYSEWGYNSFGAYYDRQPFISNHVEVPLKVIHENNKTSFIFTGQKGAGYYVNTSSFSITLTVSGLNPITYADLINLHSTTIELTDSTKEISIKEASTNYTVEILNGKFEFIRAQYLVVDEKPEEVILSGVFQFQARINGIPVTVSNGRFDVGVSDANFFNY